MVSGNARWLKHEEGFTMFNNEIFYDDEVDKLGILVYSTIASFCWVKVWDKEKHILIRNPCTASEETLAKLSRTSISTVSRRKKILRKKGYIYWKYRGKNKTCEIYLVIDRKKFLEDRRKRNREYAEEKEKERRLEDLKLQGLLITDKIRQEEYEERLEKIVMSVRRANN